MRNLNCAGTSAADSKLELFILIENEIFDPRCGVVTQIGDVLVAVQAAPGDLHWLEHVGGRMLQLFEARKDGRSRGVKSGIEIHAAVIIYQHTGIKGELIARFSAPAGAVSIMP